MLLEPVVVAAYVSPWECAGVWLHKAWFETSWSEYVVNLVVYFPLGECHVVLLDSLCRCNVFVQVNL